MKSDKPPIKSDVDQGMSLYVSHKNWDLIFVHFNAICTFRRYFRANVVANLVLTLAGQMTVLI